MVRILDRLEYRWIKIEELLLCLMGPNLQLADITESQIHTGNVRRSFNSLILLWGKTISHDMFTSSVGQNTN